MLLEVRKLLFSEDELHKAVLAQCAAERVALPPSPLQAIKLETKGQVALEFLTADPHKPHRVTVKEDFVIGALIAACRDYDVPLPRGAEKFLQMTDKGLALALSMRRETKRATDAA